MAYTIPFSEPEEFAAGDRVQWKRRLANYPAGEWTLTYYFRASFANGRRDITAAADGNDHSVDIGTEASDAWTPGDYHFQAVVTKSGDRRLIASGRVRVLPNFATIAAAHDGRTHARRTLDSIMAVIEGRATTDQQRYVFQAVGRSVDRMPISDLLKFRDEYERKVELEENPSGSGKNIRIRFN